MKKHDWDSLEAEFTTGDFQTLTEFAKYKNISYKTLYEIANKRNWLKKREECKQKILSNNQESFINDSRLKCNTVNKRHTEIADTFLTVIEKEITKMGKQAEKEKGTVNVFALEKLTSALEKCQKIHRVALGMDRDTTSNQEDRVTSLFNTLKEVFKDE